jgi:hypothetical protein
MKLSDKLQAIHARQTQVRDDDIGQRGQRQPLFGSGSAVDFVSSRFKLELNYTAELVFIFNNQYSSCGHIFNCSTRVNRSDGG